MSYRCGVCKKPQPGGDRPVKVVTKITKKRYLHRGGSESFGWEIREELEMCAPCAGNPALVEVDAQEAVEGVLYHKVEPLTHKMPLGAARA